MKSKPSVHFKQLGKLIEIHTFKRFNDVEIVSLFVELNELQGVEVKDFIELNGADVSLAKHLEYKSNVVPHGKVIGSNHGGQRIHGIRSSRQLLQGDDGLFLGHGILQFFWLLVFDERSDFARVNIVNGVFRQVDVTGACDVVKSFYEFAATNFSIIGVGVKCIGNRIGSVLPIKPVGDLHSVLDYLLGQVASTWNSFLEVHDQTFPLWSLMKGSISNFPS